MKRSDITDLQMLEAYEQFRMRKKEPWDGKFADAILKERFPDAPEKVIWAAMERVSDRNLVEYGTSLRSGWLTDKGKALLASARAQQKGPQVSP